MEHADLRSQGGEGTEGSDAEGLEEYSRLLFSTQVGNTTTTFIDGVLITGYFLGG